MRVAAGHETHPRQAIDITPPTRIAIVNAISDRSQVQFSNGSPTFLTGSFLTCSYPWWPVRVVSDGVGRRLRLYRVSGA